MGTLTTTPSLSWCALTALSEVMSADRPYILAACGSRRPRRLGLLGERSFCLGRSLGGPQDARLHFTAGLLHSAHNFSDARRG